MLVRLVSYESCQMSSWEKGLIMSEVEIVPDDSSSEAADDDY